jgi:hypothetical protein
MGEGVEGSKFEVRSSGFEARYVTLISATLEKLSEALTDPAFIAL